ncbi:MAG: RDD family protein [Terriglobales bacterium]
MKSRFQLDTGSAPGPSPRLIDPEAFDVSEQQFAASLEEKSVQPRPQFVVDYAEPPVSLPVADDDSPQAEPDKAEVNHEVVAGLGAGAEQAVVLEASSCPAPELDSWRREVAAKVNHYRGKRPRAPRYPSLQLRFESGGPSVMAEPAINQTTEVTHRGQLAITMDLEPPAVMESQATQPVNDVPSVAPPDGVTKILAFPRSSFVPMAVVEELAEPVFDRPRILEVPEVQPPPPALGGILIESTEEPKDERRPGFELPLKPAPLSRRILAGVTDALLVTAAFAGFAYIFFRITSLVPPLREGVSVGAVLLAVFWSAYQYLLLVHAGTTPGLKLAKLELSRFDGRPVPRKLRQWRVLASVLSGLSLALGYAWCFMDEDELCWHDRITHTYMAPKAGKHISATTGHG